MFVLYYKLVNNYACSIKKCGETAANSSDTAKEDCNNVSTDSGCGTGSDSTNMNSMNSIVVQTADTSPGVSFMAEFLNGSLMMPILLFFSPHSCR